MPEPKTSAQTVTITWEGEKPEDMQDLIDAVRNSVHQIIKKRGKGGSITTSSFGNKWKVVLTTDKP